MIFIPLGWSQENVRRPLETPRARIALIFRPCRAVIAPGGISNQVPVGDRVVLTIAQPFMAGFTVWNCLKSRQGRKKIFYRP
jgi:hypothetical protein